MRNKGNVTLQMISTSLRSITILCFVILSSLLISNTSNAGTQLWNFEKETKDWKVANGNWEVKDGFYQVKKGVEIEHSLVGEENWDDYTIRAKIRLDDHHWAGLVFRARSDTEYYVYYLSVPNNKTELWKHTAGAWTNRQNIAQIPAVDGVKIENGEWYEMRVDIKGLTFTMYINGIKQAENSDAEYINGKVGVWAWKTSASIDYFSIEGEKIKNTHAVDPNRKLTTTWGGLKQIF